MGGNSAVVAFSGPTQLLATIGGEVVFEIFSYVAIVVALMNMFLVGRHTRTDEETGRAELVRSARGPPLPWPPPCAWPAWPISRWRWWCSPRPPGPDYRPADRRCSAWPSPGSGSPSPR